MKILGRLLARIRKTNTDTQETNHENEPDKRKRKGVVIMGMLKFLGKVIKFMDLLPGYKTYIIAGIYSTATFLSLIGYITPESMAVLARILEGLGLATIAMKIDRK